MIHPASAGWKDSVAGRRVLVTGGTGFIGTHLVRALDDAGAEVHLLSSRPRAGLDRCHVADLTDAEAVRSAFERARPSLMFHLGGHTAVGRSWDEPAACLEANVLGTAHLLEAADGSGARIVHASSSEVYGPVDVPIDERAVVSPRSPYAVSKRAAEMLVEIAAEHGSISAAQVRLFTVYGPGQPTSRLIPEVIRCAMEGRTVELSAGTQTRDFCHVDDIVHGLLLAAVTDDAPSTPINLGTGVEHSVADVATLVLRLLGDPVDLRVGAKSPRPFEAPRMVADPTLAETCLGWTPAYSLDDGLRNTIAWWEAHLAREQQERDDR